jgi:sirohydrochlorin ferrochelatase
MSTAILLIAHGSRRQAANDDLVRVAELVQKRRPDAFVQIAYLELAAPDIPTAVRRCLERGANRVLLLPYFLSTGEHVGGDLERFRDEFARQHPGIEFTLCPPIGLHPLLIEVLLDRLAEGADPLSPSSPAAGDGPEPRGERH